MYLLAFADERLPRFLFVSQAAQSPPDKTVEVSEYPSVCVFEIVKPAFEHGIEVLDDAF